MPPVCPYCGLQTEQPADHMLSRHGITPRQHETNLARAYRIDPDDLPAIGATRRPTGGYL